MTNPYQSPAPLDDDEPTIDPRILDPAIIDLPPTLEFVLGAIQIAQGELDQTHVRGRDVCQVALQVAFDLNGDDAILMLDDLELSKSEDFGNAVYKLIEMQLIRASDDDSLEDFSGLYDTAKPIATWKITWVEDE